MVISSAKRTLVVKGAITESTWYSAEVSQARKTCNLGTAGGVKVVDEDVRPAVVASAFGA